MTDTAIAWDTYSRQRPERRPTNAAGETTWFNWTAYPDHGPGAELLETPAGGRVLDLGCGKGGNAAHLATLGMRAVGVDVSPQQLVAARARWGWTPGLQLHQADAISFLREDREGFAAVYSVYGAVWCIRDSSYIPRGADEDPLVVKRWDYEPDAWEGLLKEHGFSDVSADVLAAPPGNRKTGTLIVRARA